MPLWETKTMAIQFIPDGDPSIDDVRRARFEISEMCGHDPKRLVEYYMQRQEQHRDRLVSYGVPAPPTTSREGDAVVGPSVQESKCCEPAREIAAAEHQ